jgi:Protein of unknown function (DUF1064)
MRPLRLRRHKYGATPITIEGIWFASTKEGRRYQELRLLERAGALWALERQPAFPLTVVAADGTPVAIGHYKADFRYRTAAGVVVEDVKGVKTPFYRWKKRHVEAQYGISIVEL